MRAPRKTIPRAVIFSIILIALLYLAMNLSIIGTVPWQQGLHSKAIVADYMQTIYGRWGGVLVACLILVASWGSVFAIILGFSRVPYTAAAEGHFFKPFARLHPTGKFPTTSLLFMGGLSAVACLFSLADLISVLIVIQTMFQFAAQCIAVILLRRKFHRAGWRISNAALPSAGDCRPGGVDLYRCQQQSQAYCHRPGHGIGRCDPVFAASQAKTRMALQSRC